MGRKPLAFDWIVAIIVLCLALFGLFLLLTISKQLFFQQLAFVTLGFLIMALLSRLDSSILWWFAPYGYALSVILLVTAYFGPQVRGATRWIFFLGVQLQPSEIVKPLVILALSKALCIYSPRSMKHFPIHFGLFLLPFLLVLRQPDLGSSIVYGAVWFAMLLSAGAPLGLFLATGPIVALLGPVVWRLLAEYQQARILTFLNPALDPHGAGYNAIQAMIAVGSGQLFGRGLGRGTQSHMRFLPEFHTDFIFAALIEELGLVGGLLLLVGYGYLLWRVLLPLFGGRSRHPFFYTYSVGFFALLLSQMFINTGMNMGLLPITGITLPFVSYGGSSIISFSIGLGIIMAIRRGLQDAPPVAIG